MQSEANETKASRALFLKSFTWCAVRVFVYLVSEGRGRGVCGAACHLWTSERAVCLVKMKTHYASGPKIPKPFTRQTERQTEVLYDVVAFNLAINRGCNLSATGPGHKQLCTTIRAASASFIVVIAFGRLSPPVRPSLSSLPRSEKKKKKKTPTKNAFEIRAREQPLRDKIDI